MALSRSAFAPEFCTRFMVAPVFKGEVLSEVLVCPETNLNLFSVIRFAAGQFVEFIQTDRDEVEERIRLFSVHTESNRTNPSEGVRMEDHSTIELVDDIISEALKMKASDIHLEPFENLMTVRYRLDGILQERKTLSKELIPPLISRIKIMSGLDIAEKRRPQDGRIRFHFENRTVDIRVSVLPTDFGEKSVLRLLDKAVLKLDLGLLGFEESDLLTFADKIGLPNGIILITGPTGSGKTTTLYAALNRIKSPGINVTTIEDPIEYNLPGINQTQIKPEINLTFASALRAILRQDPNVIMVGEIRDRETLDNALRASLTGHLVLSTLHTNDAVSSIARLIDLGAERFLLSTTLKLVVAQRLVRLICPHCKTALLDQNEHAAALALGIGADGLLKGRGCEHCFQIGFSGRTAIYELLSVDEELSQMILKSAGGHEILGVGAAKGMRTLRESGVELIERGKTTPSEVLRETC